MSISDVGHAKNVSNLLSLNQSCIGFGDKYNPSNPNLSLTSIQSLYTNSLNSVKAVDTAKTPFKNAVGARSVVFKPLSKLATRVNNALDSSKVPKPIIKNAKTLTRKLQGKRASGTEEPQTPNPEAPADENSKSYSASQMSFDNRVDNLGKLINILSGQAEYKPNEDDLTVVSLTAFQNNMVATNDAVKAVYPAYNNAIIARNSILYAEETGVVDIAGKIKKYIKSVFGGNSPQYKQVSGLKFTTPKLD